MDRMEVGKRHPFSRMFVGNDWMNTTPRQAFEVRSKTVGGRTVYFPCTKGTSSTRIHQVHLDLGNAPPRHRPADKSGFGDLAQRGHHPLAASLP